MNGVPRWWCLSLILLVRLAAADGLAAGPDLAQCPRLAYVLRTDFGMSGTNATMFAHRTGVGSAIAVREAGAGGTSRVIFETREGFIWDLAPSFDGTRLLMSYKPTNSDPFHVWEIGVDGSGLRQVTDGPYHDFNPVYYPDGRIVFCSSRVESYSLCQDFLASALYSCSADGSNLRRIDFTTLCTNAPAILPDGRILCTRWEYQDKTLFSWQGLWTINPDGRQLQLFFGNTFTVPNSRYGGKPIPGTDQVMITMAAHHYPPIGDIAVVDRSAGLEAVAGMRKVTSRTPYVPTVGRTWQDANWGPGDRFFPWAVADPCPLRDGLFIASFGTPPASGQPGRFTLHLADYTGHRTEIPTDPGRSALAAVSLAPRPLPHALAGDPPTATGEGTFFVQDVYQGLVEQGVTRGQVAALRIIRQQPKKWNTEGPRYHDHYPAIGYGSYYVKENLGEVPVDAQGSAYFRAPSNCELSFVALDRDGREIQRMGTVTQVTTGETVTCIGCHEDRRSAPVSSGRSYNRLASPPDPITPPPWGAGPVDYVRHIQPILDRSCLSCHGGTTPAGGVDLSGDKTRFFSMSYHELVDVSDYYFINRGPTGVFPALRTGSRVSKLSALIDARHGGVDLDPISRRAISAWIDANVPYYATWDLDRPHTRGGRDTWSRIPAPGKPPEVEPWFRDLATTYATNCAKCHKDGFAAFTQRIADGTLTAAWEPPWQSKDRPPRSERQERWINLTHAERSRMLTAHLATDAGGFGRAPVIASTADPVYQALLTAIRQGGEALRQRPSMDLPGAVAVPQERDFGRVFGSHAPRRAKP